jgi:hypothetical protein
MLRAEVESAKIMAQLEGEAAKQNFDRALLRFLDSADETESNRLLEQLVCEFAQPLVSEIVNFKLRVYSPPAPEEPLSSRTPKMFPPMLY